MKISFDYDDTLTKPVIQAKAAKLVSEGHDVYIISARSRPDRIWRLADRLGILRSRVYATGSNTAKIQKVKDLNIDTHYDNNKKVIDELGSKGKIV